jgi:hypothetical protein
MWKRIIGVNPLPRGASVGELIKTFHPRNIRIGEFVKRFVNRWRARGKKNIHEVFQYSYIRLADSLTLYEAIAEQASGWRSVPCFRSAGIWRIWETAKLKTSEN